MRTIWQYMALDDDQTNEDQDLIAELNQLGSRGWEVVCHIAETMRENGAFLLKRPTQPE